MEPQTTSSATGWRKRRNPAAYARRPAAAASAALAEAAGGASSPSRGRVEDLSPRRDAPPRDARSPKLCFDHCEAELREPPVAKRSMATRGQGGRRRRRASKISVPAE